MGDRTEGQAIVFGMGLMGYDAMAIGPKELSLGQAVLLQRLAEAQEQGLPMLSANAYYSGTDDLIAPAYVTLDVVGRKIAVIGLTRYPGPEEEVTEFEVRDQQAALERTMEELADDVDTVILLTNVDHIGAATLAMSVPGVDLAVAARPAAIPENYGFAPETMTIVVVADMVEHDKVHGDFRGRRVGRLEVDLSADGELLNPVWKTVRMTYHYKKDPLMEQLLEMFE